MEETDFALGYPATIQNNVLHFLLALLLLKLMIASTGTAVALLAVEVLQCTITNFLL
jgi:hypothetical protein